MQSTITLTEQEKSTCKQDLSSALCSDILPKDSLLFQKLTEDPFLFRSSLGYNFDRTLTTIFLTNACLSSLDSMAHLPNADIFYIGKTPTVLEILNESPAINFYLALQHLEHPSENATYYERLYWLNEGVKDRVFCEDGQCDSYAKDIVPWFMEKAQAFQVLGCDDAQRAQCCLTIACMESQKHARAFFIKKAEIYLKDTECLLSIEQLLDSLALYFSDSKKNLSKESLEQSYNTVFSDVVKCFSLPLSSSSSELGNDTGYGFWRPQTPPPVVSSPPSSGEKRSGEKTSTGFTPERKKRS